MSLISTNNPPYPLNLVDGIPAPLKNDGVQASWDDYSIPNWMESHEKFHSCSSHHQADIYIP